MQHEPAISPEGLRGDGRLASELRHVRGVLGSEAGPGDGAARLELGDTVVQAAVLGPRERAGRDTGRAAVACEVRLAPFASLERRAAQRRDRRAAEMGRQLAELFAAVIETERFPRSEILLCVTVLQADGGIRCAAVNALTLALVDAGVPMRDLVAACAAGRVDDDLLLDPNYREMGAGLHLPVGILAESGRVVMCQLDAKLPAHELPPLLALATEGAMRVAAILKDTINSHMLQILDARAEADAKAAASNQDANDDQ